VECARKLEGGEGGDGDVGTWRWTLRLWASSASVALLKLGEFRLSTVKSGGPAELKGLETYVLSATGSCACLREVHTDTYYWCVMYTSHLSFVFKFTSQSSPS
jgi:hypothetical protein